MSGGVALGTKRLRAVQITAALLQLIVIWSVVKRFVIDMPNLAAGTMPEGEFDRRYVAQPWLAYFHMVPGAVYLLLAPLQLLGSVAATTPSIEGSVGCLPLRR
jgi:hypothetical protein